MTQGFAQGFSIRLAQDFGANDIKQLKKTYVTARRLSVLCAAAFLPALYLVYIYRSSLQGLGDTIMSRIQ